MPDDTFSEAYVRLEDTGPEWGEDHLTNHGPMARRSDASGDPASPH